METKQIGKNVIFNVLKTITINLFPIITFIYVTRVLSVEGLGKVMFVKNFVSYFCLLSSLGISYYGVREGARIHDDKVAFSTFFLELFIINIISTLLSFLIYLMITFFMNSFLSYRELLLINAISIILTGLSFEWVLSSYEEYGFIAWTSIVIQFICFFFILLFIKKESDYRYYAISLVIAGSGSSIFNWFLILKKKIVRKVPLASLSLKRHLKPIFMLFLMLISIDLYTLLDTTMLGFFDGDRVVGLYSASIKIPRLINGLIAAIGVVLVPRLSYNFDNNKNNFYRLVDLNIDVVFFITIPCAIGIFGMAEDILLLFCGVKYLEAANSLRILSCLVLVIPISVLFNNQIFIPMRKEKFVLESTCFGAMTNLIGNFLLIPKFSYTGAAISSLLSEIVVLTICILNVKKTLIIKNLLVRYLENFFCGLSILPVVIIANLFLEPGIIRLLLAIVVSALVFFLVSFRKIKNTISLVKSC